MSSVKDLLLKLEDCEWDRMSRNNLLRTRTMTANIRMLVMDELIALRTLEKGIDQRIDALTSTGHRENQKPTIESNKRMPKYDK